MLVSVTEQSLTVPSIQRRREYHICNMVNNGLEMKFQCIIITNGLNCQIQHHLMEVLAEINEIELVHLIWSSDAKVMTLKRLRCILSTKRRVCRPKPTTTDHNPSLNSTNFCPKAQYLSQEPRKLCHGNPPQKVDRPALVRCLKSQHSPPFWALERKYIQDHQGVLDLCRLHLRARM